MNDSLLAVILIGAFVLLLGGPLFLILRTTFRRHDPTRAGTFEVLDGPGEFRMALPKGKAGTLCFRFEIDGDTDDDYDLVVRLKIEPAGGAPRELVFRTRKNSRVPNVEGSTLLGSTYAVTTTMGSLELTSIGREGGVVTGTVEEGTPGLLKKGWIYLPSED